VLASLLVGVVRQLFRVVAELKATRDALAVAAVADERLRFARDLHDLLGHTLSVIVVKAEAVRRLAERDPSAAAAQAADIEQVGRRALVEIREAVTGYRDAGLNAELSRARSALAGAGVDLSVRRTAVSLPQEADSLLAWVVREAVTNVVRHSGARECEIALETSEGTVTLVVSDDGAGLTDGEAPSGNGLRGLTERLSSAGGNLRTSSPTGGGFTLEARLPIAVGS
jgi:two-component system sensor histidine kinase DesK